MRPKRWTGLTCCVPGCRHNTVKDRHLFWHSFPKYEKLRNVWVQRINRQGTSGRFSLWQPSKYHKVCGAHFSRSGRRGYMDKLPTIFPHRVFSQRWLPKREATARFVKPAAASEAQFQSDLVICSNVELPYSDDDVFCSIVELPSVASESLLQEAEHLVPPSTVEPDNVVLEMSASSTQLTQGLDHTYGVPGSAEEAASQSRRKIESLVGACEKLSRENERLIDENSSLKKEVELLKTLLHKERLNRVLDEQRQALKESRLDDLLKDEKQLRFYTGFRTPERLNVFVEFVLRKYNSVKSNVGRRTILSLREQLLVVLIRLRLGLLEQDLAYRFNVSVATVSGVFTYWVNFLHDILTQIPIWPTRATVDKFMPMSFRETYPTTRVILDCTELFIEVPSDYRNQSDTFSAYKSHNTAKGLIGIAPNGFISLVSDLSPGRVSDREITRRSGLYDLLEPHDSVMADRGFLIQEDLDQRGVTLNVPPFLKGRPQLSAADEIETRRIANLRVHVERVIRNVKTYRILSSIFPNSMADKLNKIWKICCHLNNFANEPLLER